MKITIFYTFWCSHVFQLRFFFTWLLAADDSFKELPWGALDDVVMGGVSESTFQIDHTGGENGGPTGLFKGLFLSYLIAYNVFWCSLVEPWSYHSNLSLSYTFECLLQVLFLQQTMVALQVSEQG